MAAFLANGGNATKAAEAAGYASSLSEGWRLMQTPAVRAALETATWRAVMEDRQFCRDRARKLADDPATPGDIKLRTLERLHGWADAAEERFVRRQAADGAYVPGRIADGVPDGAEPATVEGILATILAQAGTTDTQPTDKAT